MTHITPENANGLNAVDLQSQSPDRSIVSEVVNDAYSTVAEAALQRALTNLISQSSSVASAPSASSEFLTNASERVRKLINASVDSLQARSVEQEPTVSFPDGYSYSGTLSEFSGTLRLRPLPTSRNNEPTVIQVDPDSPLLGVKIISADPNIAFEPGFDWYYFPSENMFAARTNAVRVVETSTPAQEVATAEPIATAPPESGTGFGTPEPPRDGTTEPVATPAPGFERQPDPPTQQPVTPEGEVVGQSDIPDIVMTLTPTPIKESDSGWSYDPELLSWSRVIATPSGERLTQVFRPYAGETPELDDTAGSEITVQEVLQGEKLQFVFEWNTLSERSPYESISFGDADREIIAQTLEKHILTSYPFISELNVSRVIITTITPSALTDDFSLRPDANIFRYRGLNNSTFKPSYLENSDGSRTLQITLHLDNQYVDNREMGDYAMFFALSNVVYTLRVEQGVIDNRSPEHSEEVYLDAIGKAQAVAEEILLEASQGQRVNPFPVEYK